MSEKTRLNTGTTSGVGPKVSVGSTFVCLCVLAVFLSRGACNGPGEAPNPGDTMGPGDATEPSDPCANGAECDQQTLGELAVSTGATETGFRSVITGPVGAAEILWSTSGEQTMFRYKPADGVLGPEVTIDGTPANLAGVSRAAALLYGYDVASREGSAGKSGGAGGPGPAGRYTGPNGVANTAGCDVIHVYDCTEFGGCCDAHDECINVNCAGQGECGNVLHALQAGFTDQPCSDACAACHGAVMRCFLEEFKPGPSHCCEEGDCERAQECMIEGVVITDPCECQDADIESQSQVDCDRVCLPPGEPCLPDGEFSLHACACCSGTILINNPEGGGDCFTRR